MIPPGFFVRYTMRSGNFNAMCIKFDMRILNGRINDPGNYYEDLLLTLGLYLVIFVIVMGNNCRALLTVQKKIVVVYYFTTQERIG